jgi:hypothetical protein
MEYLEMFYLNGKLKNAKESNASKDKHPKKYRPNLT